MRTLHTCALVSSIALVACGGDSSTTPDAPVIIIPDAAIDAAPDAFELTFDFSCAGNAEPTTAPAEVTISGVAVEVASSGGQPSIQASHAATIDVCTGDCTGQAKLDTQITAMMGCPSSGCPFTSDALATGGGPLDGYLKVTKTGNRTSYIYPAQPMNANTMNVPALTFTNAVFQGLKLAGIITQDDGKGNLLLAFVDCANAPISDTTNLVLSVKQNGEAVQGTNVLNLSSFAPQLAGTFAIFNVPVGTTEVGATYKGTALRAHVVGVFADSTTATIVTPGFAP